MKTDKARKMWPANARYNQLESNIMQESNECCCEDTKTLLHLTAGHIRVGWIWQIN